MMKRWAIMLAVLALGLAGWPAQPAYAWPEAIETFGSGMQRGDAALALSAFSADAVITLPGELIPPDSKLLPAGQRTAYATLTLRGPEQIGAWLTEFFEQYHGRIYIEGPAHGKGQVVEANARVVADNLREVFANWPVGTAAMTLKGDHLAAVALTLPDEDLRILRRANPQAYGSPTPPAIRAPTGPRAL